MEFQHEGFGGMRLTYDDMSRRMTDLFTPPVYEMRFVGRQDITFTAENKQDPNGPFRIHVVGNNVQYINAREIKLKMNITILKKDGSPLTKKDEVSVVNNLASSMFETITVDLNNKPMSELADDEYGLKRYVEGIFGYSLNSSTSVCVPKMLYAEEEDWENNANWIHHKSTADNNLITLQLQQQLNIFNRMAVISNLEYRTIELVTALNVDCLNSMMMLPPNMSLTIHLKPKRPEFLFITKMPQTAAFGHQVEVRNEYKFKFNELCVSVPFLTLNPELRLAHERFFASGRKTQGVYQKMQVLRKQFPDGLSELSFDSFVIGNIPKQVGLFMIDTGSWDGQWGTNPFRFDHNDARECFLLVNNQMVPNEPIRMNFKRKEYSWAYDFYLNALGMRDADIGILNNMLRWASGGTTWVINTTPCGCNGYHLHHSERGTADVKIRLGTPLPKPTTLFAICVYDKMMLIDQNRDIEIATL